MQLIFEHRLQEGIEVSNQSTLRLEHQNDDENLLLLAAKAKVFIALS